MKETRRFEFFREKIFKLNSVKVRVDFFQKFFHERVPKGLNYCLNRCPVQKKFKKKFGERAFKLFATVIQVDCFLGRGQKFTPFVL